MWVVACGCECVRVRRCCLETDFRGKRGGWCGCMMCTETSGRCGWVLLVGKGNEDAIRQRSPGGPACGSTDL
eukprot:4583495-Pleurochrysis_carterae.AAC.1